MDNIPKDKNYPMRSVQCDKCGGNGCETCEDKGWLFPKDHPKGRKCANPSCGTPLSPDSSAIYCSSSCASDDA